ncbi:hypothetical protein PC129_g23318 [Phytophthora cactorum]|uniref:RxLR effector protein n=1 Tax=Phytophthora cactorum TaxID=29920 RepID=A0A329RAM1_9STRA|nr:hypothetical protein Pcac1_g7373 [Phytophthora cactorum]KAG2783170.1 hypothetical protein Pcac1_g7370 [Phytophthora cactorum]KAG2792291.1 hypothetical protein PC111_g23534 [Phytophthora cactorum]KAG2792684.1 hypothetical protein PC112_g23761 [Phytophthora cactorum]KAG2812097.1 hypothetical protein PC113_g23596 [Phytophthora cactorum]
MKLFSTLAFLALAAQFTLAAPERKLLRAGYDSPINFSNLAGLTDVTTDSTPKKYGSPAAVPGVDSITKGGILPSTNSLPVGKDSGGLGKNIIPTDLTTVDSRSGLQSLTGRSGLGSLANGATKGRNLPSLPTSGTGGVTKSVSGATENASGLTDGLGLPSTSTSGDKQVYKSGTPSSKPDVQSEERTLKSPKNPPPTPKSNMVKTKKKTTPKKSPKKKTSPKNSHKPNVKPTPKPDPEKSPFQHSVE